MSDGSIDEIIKAILRHNAAMTPGPWQQGVNDGGGVAVKHNDFVVADLLTPADSDGAPMAQADAEGIAALRMLAPALVRAVLAERAARKSLQELQDDLEDARAQRNQAERDCRWYRRRFADLAEIIARRPAANDDDEG